MATPTVTTQTQASAAALAALVRALPDTALCALLDCARWAEDTGTLPEIAQTEEDHDAIVTIVDAATKAWVVG